MQPDRALGLPNVAARVSWLPDSAAHDVAEVENVLVGEPVVDEEAIFAPLDKADGVEQLQVFRQIRLVQPRGFHQLANRQLTSAEGIEDTQPRRFAERPEPLGDDRE
jgi:hypothetical protein